MEHLNAVWKANARSSRGTDFILAKMQIPEHLVSVGKNSFQGY